VVLISPDTLIIRLLREDQWTIVFWRALLCGLTLAVTLALWNRDDPARAFRAVGRAGLLVAVFQAAGNGFFVASVTHTSAANALVIIATGPLFAALFSRVVLGEHIPLRTWIVIGCVFGTFLLVFSNGLTVGDLGGSAAAFGGALSNAAMIVAIRRARLVNMVPAIAIGSLFAAILAFSLGAAPPLISDIALLVLQGSILLPIAVGLMALAPRYAPAPDVSLIGRLEMVIGPLWVWAVIGEAPTVPALITGMVILLGLTIHQGLGLRVQQTVTAR
jgi:drug/metabolite transporter (DMT)-like permease